MGPPWIASWSSSTAPRAAALSAVVETAHAYSFYFRHLCAQRQPLHASLHVTDRSVPQADRLSVTIAQSALGIKHSAQSDANARFKQASRTPDRQRSVLRDAVQFEIGLAPQRMPKANVIIWSGV